MCHAANATSAAVVRILWQQHNRGQLQLAAIDVELTEWWRNICDRFALLLQMGQQPADVRRAVEKRSSVALIGVDGDVVASFRSHQHRHQRDEELDACVGE